MSNSPPGDEEIRLVQRDKSLPPLLHSAAAEDEQTKAGVPVGSPSERAGAGRLSFVGSLILITMAFSVGFSYLLEKRWLLRQTVSKGISQAGEASVEASTSAPPSVTPALFPLNADMLHVTAIALGHSHLAIVNGKRLAEGDSLEVKTSAGVATVRVEKIEDGIVRFSYGYDLIDAKLIPTGTKKTPP